MIHDLTAVVLIKNDEYFLPYVLESTKGLFQGYVIYDIGSEDSSVQIINDFVEENKESFNFYVRLLPDLDPKIQGIFRNSMIAEARTDFYFILDGDEVYTIDSIKEIESKFDEFRKSNLPYGVLRRTEFDYTLRKEFSIKRYHHRVYHRKAIWTGPHPGESPYINQNRSTEFDFGDKAMCYHFHNTNRSSKDVSVHKRSERKNKPTYSPGSLVETNLLKKVPILKSKIKDYKINNYLELLQKENSDGTTNL